MDSIYDIHMSTIDLSIEQTLDFKKMAQIDTEYQSCSRSFFNRRSAFYLFNTDPAGIKPFTEQLQSEQKSTNWFRGTVNSPVDNSSLVKNIVKNYPVFFSSLQAESSMGNLGVSHTDLQTSMLREVEVREHITNKFLTPVQETLTGWDTASTLVNSSTIYTEDPSFSRRYLALAKTCYKHEQMIYKCSEVVSWNTLSKLEACYSDPYLKDGSEQRLPVTLRQIFEDLSEL